MKDKKTEFFLEKLEEKYQGPGQDVPSYLHGLWHRRPINYWDYIRLDTLMTLQKPETDFPDEAVFICYHQITELYFKLILHEIRQICGHENLTVRFFVERAKRINRYFENLVHSFAVMTVGMEVEQYLEFRMALIPASGFQSAQYRMIELCATDMINLVHPRMRGDLDEFSSIKKLYSRLYWQAAGLNRETGERTATLAQFEDKYRTQLLDLAEEWREKNIWQTYLKLSEADRKDGELIEALREMDQKVNIDWPMVHLKVAERYLDSNPKDAKEATGGSDWRKYLHPKHQRRIFFPDLWSAEELAHWGE